MKILRTYPMTQRRRRVAVTTTAFLFGTTLALLCGGTQAQAQVGPPPMNRASNGGMRQQRPVTLSSVSINAMTASLALDDAQQEKVRAIQLDVSKARLAARPQPPPQDEASDAIGALQQARLQRATQAFPPPPSPEEMDVNRRTLEDIEKRGDARVLAVLTDTQKAQAPTLLKAVNTLQTLGGVPLPVMDRLNLSGAQFDSIAALPSRSRRSAVTALFTDEQKKNLRDAQMEADARGGPGDLGPPVPTP